MKRIHVILLFLLMFVSSLSIFSQDLDGDFTIKAQLRTRG